MVPVLLFASGEARGPSFPKSLDWGLGKAIEFRVPNVPFIIRLKSAVDEAEISWYTEGIKRAMGSPQGSALLYRVGRKEKEREKCAKEQDHADVNTVKRSACPD